VNAHIEESINLVGAEITIQFPLKLIGTGSGFYLMTHFVSLNRASKELIGLKTSGCNKSEAVVHC